MEQTKEQLQTRLKTLAREISSQLSALDTADGKELLSDFVSDLFLEAAEQQKKKERRRRQAEGIAAAKARGVRFGRAGKPVPDNFDEVRQAWREGELTLSQAAETCGLAQGTFYSMAARRERAIG